ncbi:MAG: bifunctional [glutamine synthetase] adenylyltransferase/[glutamine synthetase]-adenylyl-L-tyrosine phosphorylase [Pseudomonadota bacterium]
MSGTRQAEHGAGGIAPLATRLTRTPLPNDPERGAAVAARLGDAVTDPGLRALITGTAGSSPFLARLIERHADWLSDAVARPPEHAFETLLAETRAALPAEADRKAIAAGLRVMRARAVLLIALADLAGAMHLAATTSALSELAETALDIALAHLLADAGKRGLLPGLGAATAARGAGYVVIGMGKLGARELNFSSDIDLICLFDQDRFDPEDYMEARQGCIRVTRGMVELLSAQTGDGYVFRTDLRLRPNPSSTPVCLAMEAAERYYEAEGRTWERAAHIKARAVGGDRVAGASYLRRLAPFVWRRSLDFYAIEDVQSLLDTIGKQVARKRGTAPTVPGTDIKRAPGGIREIEFFAQTRQLILGGRNARLRPSGTVAALSALSEAGEIETATAEALSADYEAHRLLEHRLQMIEDAQTHSVPTADAARDRLAALMGLDDRHVLEREIAERHERVHETVAGFFRSRTVKAPPPTEAKDEGAAPFEAAGFARPEDAAARFAGWRSGGILATRSDRARRLFAGLEPRIVDSLARAASPDDALLSLERFLTGLPAGVQVLSLLAANPAWLDLVLELIAGAPRLANHLGREPQALDALLARDFFEPMPGSDGQRATLREMLTGADDYERALDRVRAFAREQSFRAGVQVLRGLAAPAEAGAAFSAIAEAALAELMPKVTAYFAARHGPPPGRGMAVLAFGKLGTREMTAGSDLDLVTLYDAALDETSEGPHPLPVQAYYPRLTKALLAALTAPTTEGRLYEVDMRLRPSGRQGPVAVAFEGFRRYHAETAWVWEHLALTRARVVAVAEGTAGAEGAEALSAKVSAELDDVLARRRGDPEVAEAAVEMRCKLAEAHRSDQTNPWSLKHTKGGLMEIEFTAQTGALACGLPRAAGAMAHLAALGETGWLTFGEAEALTPAFRLMQRLQHVERVALEAETAPDRFGECLSAALARAGEASSFEDLTTDLATLQANAASATDACFARLASDR